MIQCCLRKQNMKRNVNWTKTRSCLQDRETETMAMAPPSKGIFIPHRTCQPDFLKAQ